MKIGAITVGQAPRTDVTKDIMPIWGDKIELLQAGALDGMTYEEIQTLAPAEGDQVLVSRMTDGREVTFAERLILPNLQKCIDKLEAQGVSLIVFFCTGRFPADFRSNVPIIFPSMILEKLVPVLCGDSPLIVITPSKLQLKQTQAKWENFVKGVSVVNASPYGNIEEVRKACGEIKKFDGRLVIMDCIGYTREMKHIVASETGKNVVLSRTLVARVIDELADIN